MQAVTVQQEYLLVFFVLQVLQSGMPANFISGREATFNFVAHHRPLDCLPFVLKTIALIPHLACDYFAQDHDLLSIVLWQAITVQQEPLRRLHVLQVS